MPYVKIGRLHKKSYPDSSPHKGEKKSQINLYEYLNKSNKLSNFAYRIE